MSTEPLLKEEQDSQKLLADCAAAEEHGHGHGDGHEEHGHGHGDGHEEHGHGHDEHGHGHGDGHEEHGHGNGDGHEEHGHGHDEGGCCGGHDHGGHDHGGHDHGGHDHGGHDHDHGGHDHGHDHGDGEAGAKPSKLAQETATLSKAVWCSLILMIIEIIGGVLANSLAILTDAAHMLSDVGGFVVSIFALRLMTRRANSMYSFGYVQAGVIGAMISVGVVWVMAAGLFMEAVQRLWNPQEIDGRIMATIATFGCISNLILMSLLGHGHGHGGHGHSHGGGGHGHAEHGHGQGHEEHGRGHEEHGHGHGEKDEEHGQCHGHGHGHGGEEEEEEEDAGQSLAMRAAFIHVIGDIVQSAGVMLAGVLIWWQPFDLGTTSTGISRWVYIDPCCTIIFATLVICTTLGTIKTAVSQVMLSTPENIDDKKLATALKGVEHVISVHDLHIWSMGGGVMCTAHVVIDDEKHCSDVLQELIDIAQSKPFSMGHNTFQVEGPKFDHGKEKLTIGEQSCRNRE